MIRKSMYFVIESTEMSVLSLALPKLGNLNQHVFGKLGAAEDIVCSQATVSRPHSSLNMALQYNPTLVVGAWSPSCSPHGGIL